MADERDAKATPLYRYRFADVEFDQARFELRVAGEPIALQQKPLEILELLLARPGEVVTKEELLETVWEGRPTVENVIANAVTKLRAALGDVGAAHVVTLPRIGYRFDGTLERVAVGRLRESALQLQAGSAVPGRSHFALEAQLGSSSRSEVWLARQTKTREPRVYKFCADGSRLASLKREATLARLLQEHLGTRTDFTRVLDWNFETTPFYLECEYGGLDLQRWDDTGQRLAAMPLDERLSLFLQVADAVAAAHSIGVLHKDLKPANILVAPAGQGWQIRLTDFGSSQLLEPARLSELGITRLGLTTTGAIDSESSTGTPLYLAPELVTGSPPTIASDVYTLGVILFQLAAGDLRRQLVPGWERAIPDSLLREDIVRATDGDPAQRLSSASELALRLRHLAARRADAQRREAEAREIAAAQDALRRSRERRPWIIGAVATLLVGLVVSGWMWRESEAQRRVAEQQAARAEATVRFLSDDLLGAVSPGGSAFERDPSIMEVLEFASTQMNDRLPTDMTIRGSIHAALGEAFRVLGNRERSTAELQRAVADYSAAFGASDETTLRARYALVRTLAYSNSADEFAAARRELDEADRLGAGRLRNDGELALAAAIARGTLEFQQMRIEPALAAWRNADRLQRVVRPQDAQVAVVIRNNLADCILRQGKPQEAIELLRATLADPLIDANRVGGSRIASLRVILARALRNQGRFDEALPVAKAALEVTERLSGADDYQTLVQMSLVASIHEQAGRCVDALEIMRVVRTRMAARYGEDKQATLVETGNLGMGEYECGDRNAGIEYVRRAESELRRLFGEDNVAAHSFRHFLATALAEQERWSDALDMAEGLDIKALAAGDSKPGWEHRLAALRGEILIGLGRRDEGRALLSNALPEVVALGVIDADEVRRLSQVLARASQ